MVEPQAGALDGVRVLDCTTAVGQYCGKLLADLGADVIKVELPGGDPARGLGPFFHDTVGRENSLSYWYFNANKRSVTCDLDHPDGQHLFRELAGTVDIVLESYPAGWMEARGAGYEALRAAHPDLIYVSITGFGLSGPHAAWHMADIVGQAMAGVMTLAGHPDDPPNLIGGDQGYIVASIAAGQGALLALFAKERGGTGQLVEVSMQEALAPCQETAMQYWDLQRVAGERIGDQVALPGIGTYQTRDGYIYSMVGTPGFGGSWGGLLAWMAEEGMAEDLTDPVYADRLPQLDRRLLALEQTNPQQWQEWQPVMARAREVLLRFFASKSSRELYEEGQRRRLLIGIASTPKDLAENPQFAARNWFHSVEQRGESITFPGPPYRLSQTPVAYRRPAPCIGEHNDAIWVQELGISADDLAVYAAEGAL